MQEHFYVLYVFIVQSQWWSGNHPPYLSTLKIYPTPRKVLYPPFLHQNDRKGCPDSYLKSFCVKIERFRVSGKKLSGVVTTPIRLTMVKILMI